MAKRISDDQLNAVAIDRSDADGTYILVFRDSQVSQAICALGRWADNPKLAFTWYDAAVAAQMIRATPRGRT
jgi:uncharacterized membrane protein SpoIIM required for sporulation